MSSEFSKNSLQLYFNQVKGELIEMNIEENFSNLTVAVGHNKLRKINFVAKTEYFEEQVKGYEVGQTITVKFYLSSNFKHNHWYTTATILSLEKN
jgi:hypothetical protein